MQDTVNNPDRQPPSSPPAQFRSAIILPDGRKSVPLGSGVITSLLGEGGMANVYEIWNPQLEVHRAVKLLHPNCSDESKERFQTEIKITAKLHHPNIIEIHGVGEWNSLPLIEMEKIDGCTLENLIWDRGALPVTVCTAVGIMIARALTYAHNQVYIIYSREFHGVIHRDLKPSNIMVCKDGTVKLMDFGIARPTDASIHTTDGSILGTMQYLSPEQIEGKDPDVRTDIYSLGTTLYEAVTGVQAFPERNVSKLMMNKIKNEYKQLDEFSIKIPPRLKRIIHKCMMHDRERRIASAALLLAELEKIHKSLTLDTPDQSIKQLVSSSHSGKIVVNVRRKIPYRPIAAALLIAGAGAGLFSLATQLRTLREEQRQKDIAEATRIAMQRATPPAAPAQETPAVAAPVNTPAPSWPRASEKPPRSQSAPAPRPRDFLEQIIDRHGTSDMLEILVAEFNRGNYLNAAIVYSKMPAQDAQSVKASIYHMRTLSALGKTAELEQFLAENTVNDAEYYLQKAVLAYQHARFSETGLLLERALASPRQFMESDKLRREAYYYKALCATSAFDASPGEKTYKNALDAWWQVRNELRTSPGHTYNQKAVTETQRIGEKYRAIKG